MNAEERREQLKNVFYQASSCTLCELSKTRTNVVFGAGNADADVMFIGEGPGANEDKQGLPFVGAAGKLLGKLLEEVGLSREEIFIANVVKCRPPENRDPQPIEIETCKPYLYRQIELIQPQIVCTLGNFSTKLLREDPTGITKLHGVPEIRSIGPRKVRLLPIFHPAAALYNPSTLNLLKEDFAKLPELLLLPPLQQS